MRIKFQTRKQYDAEAEKLLQRNMAMSDLMKLTGRCLTAIRETRDYLKAAGPQSIWNGPIPPDSNVTSYEEVMALLNSLLDRKEATWNPKTK